MVQSSAGLPQKTAAIICLEGASAAGKTTLSHAIAARTDAAVIAEVWAFFERPSPEPPLWYLERQVERWRFAVESAGKHGLSILDGDPFQPLWYGWAYGFIEPHTLTTVTSFYHDAIAAGSLAFPDRYILLAVSEPELRARKQRDASRSRRNFAKHVSLLRHQPRYFAAMNRICPGLAYVLNAGAPVTTLAETAISVIRSEQHAEDSLTILQYVAHWLRTTPPEAQG
jgi:deoxyadenosine/deoxycytidine kinase